MTDIKKSKDSEKVEDVEVDVDELEENGANASGGGLAPIKRPETEEEKKRKRLERFGLSLKADGDNEADRKKKRLERFGATTGAASSTSGSGLTEAEKIERRKNKFGTLTEADKQKKREKKFRQNANGNANKNKNGGKPFNVQAVITLLSLFSEFEGKTESNDEMNLML